MPYNDLAAAEAAYNPMKLDASGGWARKLMMSLPLMARLLAAVRPEEGAEYGITCKLGDHAPAIVYAESRLRRPLRRKGPKGTHEFEPVSWDAAWELIVGNLRRTDAADGTLL